MPRSIALLAILLPTTATADDTEFFESKIRPVLVERCYHCHNSAEEANGGLALDYRDGLRDGVEEPLIVPGKPEKSRLLAILRHEISGLEMPEDSGKLSGEVVADFEKWIRDGATDPRDKPPSASDLAKATSWEAKLAKRRKWWSFQSIRHPQVPKPKRIKASSPIDKFIAAKLEAQGLEPSNPAEPNVLVRRAYFAVIGLPPDPKESARWVKAMKANHRDGMAKMVQHLLDSPHFGERWARHWMDWIRYAESHGSEGDPRIDNAYHYRDYLIRALNDDVPYDQLVREHIAGDLLQNPRINHQLGINESAIGPAHWRMVFHGFAPTDALDEKVRFTDDQINAFSKAFLGLTVSCARCHDHKFDAISQKDYYALFGILGSTRPARTVIDVDSKVDRNRKRLEGLKPQIRKALIDHWADTARLVERIMESEPQAKPNPDSILYPLRRVQSRKEGESFEAVWASVVRQLEAERDARRAHRKKSSAHRWSIGKQADYQRWFPKGSGLPEKPHPAGTFTLAPQGPSVVENILPSGVYSNAISSRHAARMTSPDIRLNGEYDLWVRAMGSSGATVRYAVQNYPRNGTVFPVGNLTSQWRWHRYSLKYWNGDNIHIELTTGKDAPLLVRNNQRSWFGVREAMVLPAGEPAPPQKDWSHFNALLHAAKTEVPTTERGLYSVYVGAFANALDRWAEGRSLDSDAIFLDACLKSGLLPNELKMLPSKAKSLVEEYRRLENEITEPTRVPGLDETLARNQPLFERGDHRKPGEPVPRRFLEAIDATPYDTRQSGRRELAEDVLRDDNPLTNRVIVNRIWHHLFGRGLVATPNNFGQLGQKPTHPELLDFLASRFPTQHNQTFKSQIFEILMTDAWQRSSAPTTDTRQADPDNRLLAHANVRRLEAEAIRDSMLTVSGQLDRKQFGPSVGGTSPRRSVYVQVIRNSLDPFLRAFDFPEPFSSTGRRDATNVPAQSLMMMNDEFVNRVASAWVDRARAAPGDSPSPTKASQAAADAADIDFMFRTAFGRAATQQDVARIEAYLASSTTQLRARHHRLAELRTSRDRMQADIASLVEPVRARLIADARNGNVAANAKLPEPVHRWEFKTSAKDVIGAAHAKLRGGAKIEGGALVVRNGGHAVSAPLGRKFAEKTLEAWVQLDNLNQRGGGVMTMQSPNGVMFDSIVFGERDPRRWLAGSNNFARTQPFELAPAEDLANREPVHVAIAYHRDGRIVGYRNGKPYGRGYKSNALLPFKENSVISFGLRHLPAGSNRMLSGRILTAQVYDRALTSAEVAATSKAAPFFISEATVLAQLTERQRDEISKLESRVSDLAAEIVAMGNIPDPNDQETAWRNLARAMLTFKEFIYIR